MHGGGLLEHNDLYKMYCIYQLTVYFYDSQIYMCKCTV